MPHTPRSFARTLADLNTKLNRQKAAVEGTLEMIEAVTALAAKEAEKYTLEQFGAKVADIQPTPKEVVREGVPPRGTKS